jgi:predicted DNA-binding transcriptional regulator AlpA
MPNSDLLTIREVSEITGLAVRSLYGYRNDNAGPPSYKYGRQLLYPAADLEVWMIGRKAATLRGSVFPRRPFKEPPTPSRVSSIHPTSEHRSPLT